MSFQRMIPLTDTGVLVVVMMWLLGRAEDEASALSEPVADRARMALSGPSMGETADSTPLFRAGRVLR